VYIKLLVVTFSQLKRNSILILVKFIFRNLDISSLLSLVGVV
jgi:hypothetical protein